MIKKKKKLGIQCRVCRQVNAGLATLLPPHRRLSGRHGHVSGTGLQCPQGLRALLIPIPQLPLKMRHICLCSLKHCTQRVHPETLGTIVVRFFV